LEFYLLWLVVQMFCISQVKNFQQEGFIP